MNKQIIVCADDYAQNPAISQGIIHLIAQKRLTAVSCLATARYWPEHADWLKPYRGQIDIGLHFNLTLGPPQTNTLGQIILAAYSGKLVEQTIYNKLNQQIDQFEKALGIQPNFIDGHEHVHALPIVRRALIRCYSERLKSSSIWIRNICPANATQLFTQPDAIKKSILYFIGGKTLKRLLTRDNIPHNTSFAGIYNFNTNKPYAQLFPLFLQALTNNGLIMCHPGLASDDSEDPIANNRIKEYEYFSSELFLKDCQHAQIRLARFCTER